jgi:hypothetical protein
MVVLAFLCPGNSLDGLMTQLSWSKYVAKEWLRVCQWARLTMVALRTAFFTAG